MATRVLGVTATTMAERAASSSAPNSPNGSPVPSTERIACRTSSSTARTFGLPVRIRQTKATGSPARTTWALRATRRRRHTRATAARACCAVAAKIGKRRSNAAVTSRLGIVLAPAARAGPFSGLHA
jgi:hypothetical protein